MSARGTTRHLCNRCAPGASRKVQADALKKKKKKKKDKKTRSTRATRASRVATG